MNKVIMMGHLTKNSELKQTKHNMLLATNSIATNRFFMQKNGERGQETCYVDLSVFGKAASIMGNQGLKGSRILIEGRLLYSQWHDKETGATRSKHSIIVESLQLLDYNKNKNANQQNMQNTQQVQNNMQQNTQDLMNNPQYQQMFAQWMQQNMQNMQMQNQNTPYNA